MDRVRLVYHFGPFAFCAETGELFCLGHEVKLPPRRGRSVSQAVVLLRALLKAPGHRLSHSDLVKGFREQGASASSTGRPDNALIEQLIHDLNRAVDAVNGTRNAVPHPVDNKQGHCSVPFEVSVRWQIPSPPTEVKTDPRLRIWRVILGDQGQGWVSKVKLYYPIHEMTLSRKWELRPSSEVAASDVLPKGYVRVQPYGGWGEIAAGVRLSQFLASLGVEVEPIPSLEFRVDRMHQEANVAHLWLGSSLGSNVLDDVFQSMEPRLRPRYAFRADRSEWPGKAILLEKGSAADQISLWGLNTAPGYELGLLYAAPTASGALFCQFAGSDTRATGALVDLLISATPGDQREFLDRMASDLEQRGTLDYAFTVSVAARGNARVSGFWKAKPSFSGANGGQKSSWDH